MLSSLSDSTSYPLQSPIVAARTLLQHLPTKSPSFEVGKNESKGLPILEFPFQVP